MKIKLIRENKIAIGELTDGVQKINTEYEYLKNGYLIISVLKKLFKNSKKCDKILTMNTKGDC